MTIRAMTQSLFLFSGGYVTGCIAASHEELKIRGSKFGISPNDELLLKRVEEYSSQTFYSRSLDVLQAAPPPLSDANHLAKYQSDKRNLYRRLLQEIYSEVFILNYSIEKEAILLKIASKIMQVAKTHINSLQYLQSTSISVPERLIQEEAVLAKDIKQLYDNLEELAELYKLSLPKFPDLSDGSELFKKPSDPIKEE